MNKIVWFYVCLLIVGCKNAQHSKLRIAVAANMQYVMEEIINEFEKNTSESCELIVGSSGKLMAQILEGAPYDIFISADKKYVDPLFESGTSAEPQKFARGRLVLWSIHQSDNFDLEIEDLTKPIVERIALANPKTAPYGEAAIQFLQNEELYEGVKNKLVYGESIAQVNQFIISGNVSCGLTAKSVVLLDKMVGKGSWIDISPSNHQPIEQYIARITGDRGNSEITMKFLKFLNSEKCASILEKFGYLPSFTI